MMKAMERLINEELEKKNDDEEVLKKVNPGSGCCQRTF